MRYRGEEEDDPYPWVRHASAAFKPLGGGSGAGGLSKGLHPGPGHVWPTCWVIETTWARTMVLSSVLWCSHMSPSPTHPLTG